MSLSAVRAALQDPESSVLVLTGAGISAGSGLATYRGAGGLYATGGMPPLSSRDARSGRLGVMWAHLAPLVSGAAAAAPSRAHLALAAYAESRPGAVCVATQNVDGLHQQAGSTTLELHGSLRTVRCIKPGHTHEHPLSACERDADGVPRCPSCGTRTRPAVVLFDEGLDPGVWDEAVAAARGADVVLAVGTSLQVFPAAQLVEEPLTRNVPGAWLELDPARALRELSVEAAAFTDLVAVAGPVDETLPALLGD